MAGEAPLGPEAGAGALYRVRGGGEGQQAVPRRALSVAGGREAGAPRLLRDSHPKLKTLRACGASRPRVAPFFQMDVDPGLGRNLNA